VGWFLVTWTASSAAMMLPSAVPFVRTLAASEIRVAPVLAGYLAVWAAAGVIGYAAMTALDAGVLSVGVGLLAAGAYQLSPLKHACLRRCRSPFHFLLHRQGAFRIGLEYGATCFACCAGLMLTLVVIGMSSVVAMAVVGGLIAAEKLLAVGPKLALVSAGGLLVAGGVAVLA
jgi:predicted metal-binding membrane protein